MSLTDDINSLPATPQDVMPGHLNHHAIIHSALKNMDATKWDRGDIPTDITSMDDLSDGYWWTAGNGYLVGLPGSLTGTLILHGHDGTTYRSAMYIPTSGSTYAIYTARRNINGWGEWIKHDSSVEKALGYQGDMPTETTSLDDLVPGTWWVSGQGDLIGLPGKYSGSLSIVQYAPQFKTVTFVRTELNYPGVWTRVKSYGVWGEWQSFEAHRKMEKKGLIPDETTSLDDLGDGYWWSAAHGIRVGLPSALTGSLTLHGYNDIWRIATFISISASGPGVYLNYRNSNGWAGWTSPDSDLTVDKALGYQGNIPTETTSLDDLAPGTWWSSGSGARIGLPVGLSGTLSIARYSNSYQTAIFNALNPGSKGFWANDRYGGGWTGWRRIDKPESVVVSADYFPDLSAPLESNTDRVVMWGDSLTAAGRIVTQLGSLQPGVEFVNKGISGQRSREIAARQGGEMVQVNIDSGIPESGSVAVTDISQRILNRTSHPGGSIHGSILGVPGTLSVPAGSENAYNYTFTRDSSGVSIPVRAGSYFVPDDALEYRRDAHIIWVGRNDISGPNPVLAVHAMVKWPSPAVKKVLVLSYTGDSKWAKGSPQHSEVVRINLELSSICGDSYVDLRRWLIDHGLDAVGVTPTQEDLDAIAGDTLPPSLAPDGTHFNTAAQNAIGTWIHGELVSRGWWD